MARNSIVQLIFFVAVVSMATVFVGMMVTEVALFTQSTERESERATASIDADVLLVNDPEAASTYDGENETVTLYVKNVGGSTLEPPDLDVLLDGTYVEPTSTEILDADHWRVGRVLEVTLDRALDTGDHRAVVRIHGAEDVLEFEHREVFWQDPSDQPGTSDCDVQSCTVDGGETDSLELTMGTEPIAEGESVDYAVNDTSIATVYPESGVTDDVGENETTLFLEQNGTVDVTLENRWGTDVITVTIVNVTGPFFEVSEFEAPSSAERGETITVNATVENTGTETDTQSVDYRFDDEIKNTTEVTLESGESEVTEFEYTVDVSSGTYSHGIYSDDDDDTGTITVTDD